MALSRETEFFRKPGAIVSRKKFGNGRVALLVKTTRNFEALPSEAVKQVTRLLDNYHRAAFSEPFSNHWSADYRVSSQGIHLYPKTSFARHVKAKWVRFLLEKETRKQKS
ncbi:MAG: hypothetical protein V1834_03560 [Candidatus Micrarchaeota archaeon]